MILASHVALDLECLTVVYVVVCNLSPANVDKLEPDSPPPATPASSTPASPASVTMDTAQQELSEDIIREQKRRIEQLQRQLLRSQLQLQHQSTFQVYGVPYEFTFQA